MESEDLPQTLVQNKEESKWWYEVKIKTQKGHKCRKMMFIGRKVDDLNTCIYSLQCNVETIYDIAVDCFI